MADSIPFYIDILRGSSSGLSAIGALKSLDDSAAKASSGIQALEANVGSAQKKLETLKAGDNIKGIAMELADAKAKLDAIRSGKTPFDAGEYKRASDSVGKLGSQLDAAKSKNAAAIDSQKSKVEALTGKLNEQKAAQASNASLVSAKRALIKKGLDEQVSGLSGILNKAKESGGPLGNLAGKLEGLGKGGAAGAAIAVVVALAAIATGAIVAAVALARYALTAADAARTSRLFSEAALGSAAAGNELETVVNQMTNLAPGLAAKLKDVGRSLADVNIRGRDAQRVLETFGIVATARGEQAAGAIKSIAEASRVAGRLMLGPLNRITGQFDSLKGTGIKSADVFKALGKVMGTSADAAQKATRTGLVPFKKGLEAIELAAQMSLGGVVAKQMMGLDVQAAKLKENIAKLFSGANIDKFLEGLKTVSDLFDSNTVTGYILREVFTAAFTKIANVASRVFPYIKAAIEGVVFAVLLVATVAKSLYRTLQETFGGAGKNIDGISLAFRIGAIMVGAFVGAVVGLTAALVLLGTVAALALAPIWVPFALMAFAIYLGVKAIGAIVDAIDATKTALGEVDLGAAAKNIVMSLVNGLKAHFSYVTDAMSSLGGLITGAFDTKMEIASPSKVMTRRANWIVDPLVDVPNERASEVNAAIGGLGGLDKPQQLGNGKPSADKGGDINFYDCVFGTDPNEIRRIIREERALFFMGNANGNAMETA
jgi:hypothetical protein